jgi:ABC-type phosphate transport system substrate-binding protein
MIRIARRASVWATLATVSATLAALGSGLPAIAATSAASAPSSASAASVAAAGQAGAAYAGSYATLSGSGSSWASVALDQWAQDLEPEGLTVNFNPDGSASGRGDYMQGSQVDFAASDPPFRNGNDELAGTGAEDPSYGYSYVPDVGGGTAFMYHITVGGKLITNLRLSGETLMKIFTGQITNWDNAEITKDYGAQLPNEPITVVVRSDGSGATYFLTRWMSKVFPTQWDAFCNQVHPGIKQPCPQTEFYPSSLPNFKAENGSNNVSTYITSSYGEGAIGYDEYAYALNAHWPVVAMENPAGYYVLPSASNVAVALTQAQINEDASSQNFLQQDLDDVYTYTDPRSYPLSSYSYLIVPNGKSVPPIFNDAVGKSLSTYINFYLCQGQTQAGQLGYSPLPINLVKGAFLQVNKIPGTIGSPSEGNYSHCDNPTFNAQGQDVLLNTAPYPNKCQKVGSPLNCNPNGTTTSPSTSPSSTDSTAPTSTSSAGTSNNVSSTSDPGSTVSSGTTAQNADITGGVVNVPNNGTNDLLLAVITAFGVLLAVAAPPSVAAYLRRRRGGLR